MRKRQEIISLTVTPDQVTCAWISKPTAHFPLVLHATQTWSLNSTQPFSIHLFNATHVKQSLTQFIASNGIKKPRIVIALNGDPLHESILSLSQKSEFMPQNNQFMWQSCPLFLLENGEPAEYLCGIPTSLILQYQLLALRVGHPITRITTDTYARMALYRAVNNTAYRDSKLLDHFRKQNNSLQNLFSKETIARILKPSTNLSFYIADHAASLLTACGLTLLENRYDTRH